MFQWLSHSGGRYRHTGQSVSELDASYYSSGQTCRTNGTLRQREYSATHSLVGCALCGVCQQPNVPLDCSPVVTPENAAYMVYFHYSHSNISTAVHFEVWGGDVLCPGIANSSAVKLYQVDAVAAAQQLACVAGTCILEANQTTPTPCWVTIDIDTSPHTVPADPPPITRQILIGVLFVAVLAVAAGIAWFCYRRWQKQHDGALVAGSDGGSDGLQYNTLA